VLNDSEGKSEREAAERIVGQVAQLVTNYMTKELAELVAQKVAYLMSGVTSVASSSTIGEWTPRTFRAASVDGGSLPPFEDDNLPQGVA
jgi:hypothetical protein